MAKSTDDPSESQLRKKVQTEAQFVKCGNPRCGETLFVRELAKNLNVCKTCDYHFRIGAPERIRLLFDEQSFQEHFAELESVDPLNFVGKRSYLERIKGSQQKTGLKDAVVCGTARLDGIQVVVAAMDFRFMGGSMGSVVGEKVTRAIELATQLRCPAIVICCSGGARMDEGALSLMQMTKTSAAIQRHHEVGLPYFTILTDPTLAGVSASYAFLADVIIGEPGAMIGFTGARVIQDTIKVQLPEGFQTAEFLLEHGQIDKVVHRSELRQTVSKIVRYATEMEQQPAPGESVQVVQSDNGEVRVKTSKAKQTRAVTKKKTKVRQ